ncbi:MAG: HD domain-containing protein, partial [Bacilli bacterium]
KLLALAGALLHDIGHGPFSHSFEKVFDYHHEDLTIQMILGETEVNGVLRRVDEKFPQDLADVIAKKYHNQMLVSLISSQIDVDRMDYLLRDSYFTGVSYGEFDLERILRVIRPYGEQSIVFKESGMFAIEHFIMSRYQMYWQIYFHPVTRAAEMVLTKILKRAKALYVSDYMFQTPPVHFESFFKEEICLNEYINLDEGIMYYYFSQWQKEEDAILSDLCERFLNRRLFKYVNYTDERKEEVLAQLQKAGLDPVYYYTEDSPSNFPYDVYRLGDHDEVLPVLLLQEDGSVVELSERSPIVAAIMNQERSDKKIYFPETVVLNHQ